MGGPLDLALRTITLIFPTEELNDIIKIIKSLKDSGLLIKDFTETVKNEIKRQKKGFLVMLALTLCKSLLENMWAGKDVLSPGKEQIQQAKEQLEQLSEQ